MSINIELQNLKFLLNAGISEFLQNNPNTRYHIQNEKKDANKILSKNNIQDIHTLDSLEQYIKNLIFCNSELIDIIKIKDLNMYIIENGSKFLNE